ncbi:MAG: lysine--tRNA ligase [Chloroflexi bacterium]|nr:lysine--tRNA ligase [Chloroflexota bacterium]
MPETNDRREQRLEKLGRLHELGIDPYPPRAEHSHTVAQALAAFDANASQPTQVTVVGRLVSLRVMGGSTFCHIADGTGRIQLYLRRDAVGQEDYENFRRLIDLGDHVWATGTLFQTRSGEITVNTSAWRMLSKALRPLPDKWHGLRDVEMRYRQRYLDLIANPTARDIFITRSKIVSAIRHTLDGWGFMEVETPVLQPIYGGAAARPFTTHHNALDQTFYLRIADELYLKRLIVGGLDRVYEIGHNFRNEGISTHHNPEFTVVELYQAYADYEVIMRLVETLYSTVARTVLGTETLSYQGQEIQLTPPWRRVTMRDAILEASGIDIELVRTLPELCTAAESRGLSLASQPNWGKAVEKLFELTVEPSLVQPTFVIDYPVDISPLAKKKPGAPHLVERFEFFIGGLECGNAFTELNDPIDQRERFAAQVAAGAQGDSEAHPMDEDYIAAMEHGMPPTGGLGFGIDRMVMLYTDQVSIREVILFPALRDRGGDWQEAEDSPQEPRS